MRVCWCVLLQCGELVQLQLTEAHPDLLEIGSNQDETKKLLEEHDQLLVKLKVVDYTKKKTPYHSLCSSECSASFMSRHVLSAS